MPPVVLTIAGSDNSCGAGAQADLKTITALGGYGLTAITCVVAEVPGRVLSIQPIKPRIVAEQIQLALEAFPVAAIKTGMLYDAAIISAVADALPMGVPLVIDPVMVASSGDRLVKKSAIAAYEALLFPRASVITPNLDELAVLGGRSCEDVEAMIVLGRELMERVGVAILLKGGHFPGRFAEDVLVQPHGTTRFVAPYRRGLATHGTGCTLSAAIATGLAHGLDLEQAVGQAKFYISQAIENCYRWPTTMALNHSSLFQKNKA